MENGTKMKSLTLDGVASGKTLDLSFIPSNSLANAFKRLESLTLDNVKLRISQLKAILDYMSVKSKVKNLSLQNMEFEFVNMDMFDSALANLTSLSFAGSTLDDSQLKYLIEALYFRKCCKLKTLILPDFDMRHIEPNLLAKVINSVENVSLENVDILVKQLEEIFLLIIQGDPVLKCLDLDEVDAVIEVKPDLLAKAVNKLEHFKFGGSSALSENQTKEMFTALSCGTNLKMLGTPSDQLALEIVEHIDEVDPDILAKAVNNLDIWIYDQSNFGSICCHFQAAKFKAD